MRVYLHCDENREDIYRESLEADFSLSILHQGEYSGPEAGDVLLVDLATRPEGWRDSLEMARRGLGEEVRILAVLRSEQIRGLDHRIPLDDFVAEGSSGDEIRARLRRITEEAAAAGGEAGELVIDEDRYEARMGGIPVALTFKEFELLRFLAVRPGKVFTREVLLEQVWGYDYFGGARTVDVHIRRIRSKIEREGHTYIRTVRGVGYIFEHPSS
jgi:DNA-binding response OmpR family regulator